MTCEHGFIGACATCDGCGQMEDASEESFTIWAERYDKLNGAPENEQDR